MTVSIRSAVALSVIGRYLTLSCQFVSTMILARLLTPEDIGVYSAGFSIVALAHLFRDFGLNQYIIQEKNLDPQKIRVTFTLSLIITWFLSALLYLLATPAAAFFNESGVEPLIHILAFNFLIIPFGTITLALLRKKLKFHITSCISLIAAIASIVVAVWTAYNGARYLCLAYGAITETSATVLLSFFFRPKGSTMLPSLRGAKKIFRFGSIVGIGNILSQAATSVTDAMIARILGLTALGFYSRAYGTFSLFDNVFVSSIRPTILPLFAQNNHDPVKLADNYLKAVSYSLIFAWPFFTFLFLFTDEVISTLYGTQWGEAIPLVKILCGAGLVLPLILFTENLFVANDQPEVTLRIQAITNIAKIVLVVTACFISVKAVCIALVASFFIKFIVVSRFVRIGFGILIPDLIPLAKPALIPLATTILPTLVADQLMRGLVENHITYFAILIVCGFLGWLFGLKTSKHAFYDELKPFFSRKGTAKQTDTPNANEN